ncbi:MAG: hypothetical protein IJ856_03900 [Candidatus Methanomethylophilaceae archaeon]|nr:hypothetical protein [Candidatus Methanomethylophilaceae archaeon]
MKIDRFKRIWVSIVFLAIAELLITLLTMNDGVFDMLVALNIAVVAVGAFFMYRNRFSEMRSVMGILSMTIGISVLVMSIYLAIHADSVIFPVMAFIMGMVFLIPGISLWAGNGYNAIRIKLIADGIGIIAIVLILSGLEPGKSIVNSLMTFRTQFAILFLVASVHILITEDYSESMSQLSMIKRNMTILSQKFLSRSDLYVLEEDADTLVSAFKESTDKTVPLRCTRGVDGDISVKQGSDWDAAYL